VAVSATVKAVAGKARRVQAGVKARPLRVRVAEPDPVAAAVAAGVAVRLLEAALVEAQWPKLHAVTPVSADVAVAAVPEWEAAAVAASAVAGAVVADVGAAVDDARISRSNTTS